MKEFLAVIRQAIEQVTAGRDLSMDDMAAVDREDHAGRCGDDEVGCLLTALHEKGESVEEVAGAAAVLRRHMTPIRSRQCVLIDTCGTGGDHSRHVQHQHGCRTRDCGGWRAGGQARESRHHQQVGVGRCSGCIGRQYRGRFGHGPAMPGSAGHLFLFCPADASLDAARGGRAPQARALRPSSICWGRSAIRPRRRSNCWASVVRLSGIAWRPHFACWVHSGRP